MTKRKKGERSEAQVIADKHNQNCFCLEGVISNLNRIIDDCPTGFTPSSNFVLKDRIERIKGQIRCAIEQQYEYEKDKAGKSTPPVKLVGK